jgi:REP element-mobilizing transposase RayT
MSQNPPRRLPGPPHNPALRELVTGKRNWSANRPEELGHLGFKGWHERGYLPHRDEPGLTQFVTFHLGDSFPMELQSEWATLLQIEDEPERREQLQSYLDKGCGECLLRRADVAQIVEDSLLFYHGQRYELRSWVLMPNHAHILFKVGDASMSRTVEDWKKFTSHAVNKLLGRKGRFWFEDYWDTYMRDSEHELRTRHYIEANPVKAGLVKSAKDWKWGSARRRDAYERLCL